MRKVITTVLLALIVPAVMNATVGKPVPTCTTSIQTGQTYYLYNPASDLFVNRGENYYTRLCAGNFGLPFTLQTSSGDGAYYNFVSQKNGSGAYWNAQSQWEAYYDATEDKEASRFKIESVEGETYFHLRTQASGSNFVFSVQPSWSDRSLQGWTGSDGADCRWCFVTEADYQSYLLALDAYASAYGMDLSQSICRKGTPGNYPSQSGVYDAQNGYICNGTTSVESGHLVVVPLWDNLHLMEELPYMPSGRYTLNINATINDNQWCDVFMMGTNSNWQLDDGSSNIAKSALRADCNFNYDNSQGDLRIGFRSWNIGDWTAQDFSQFSANVSDIDLIYRGSGQHSVVVGATGYATLFLPYTTTIPEGVEAFTGEINGEYLVLSELEGGVIPAETAVVLRANPGTYTFVQTEAAAFTGVNDLKGDISKTAQESGSTYYALASPGGATAFYKLQEGVPVPPFKSYLTIAASSSVKAFLFDDEATGISELSENSECSDAIYNLSGQRIDRMQKGINIRNGRKILK